MVLFSGVDFVFAASEKAFCLVYLYPCIPNYPLWRRFFLGVPGTCGSAQIWLSIIDAVMINMVAAASILYFYSVFIVRSSLFMVVETGK